MGMHMLAGVYRQGGDPDRRPMLDDLCPCWDVAQGDLVREGDGLAYVDGGVAVADGGRARLKRAQRDGNIVGGMYDQQVGRHPTSPPVTIELIPACSPWHHPPKVAGT